MILEEHGETLSNLSTSLIPCEQNLSTLTMKGCGLGWTQTPEYLIRPRLCCGERKKNNYEATPQTKKQRMTKVEKR
jgi:hypothetical protein